MLCIKNYYMPLLVLSIYFADKVCIFVATEKISILIYTIEESLDNEIDLKNHLDNSIRPDVTHLSPQSQNEQINVIEKHCIIQVIINEIKESGFHSIFADEITSKKEEILSICDMSIKR